MKIIRSIISFFVIIGILSSCNPSTHFGSVKHEISTEYVNISDIENNVLYQDISYPKINYIGNEHLSTSINNLNELLKKEAEKFKDENKDEIRLLKKESPDREGYYEYNSKINLISDNGDYLSLCEEKYVYLMGAHGSTIIKGYNYDVKTGNKYIIFDLIKDVDNVKEFIIDKLESEHKEDLFDEYKETIDKYMSGEYELEFVIRDGVVSVIFQQYDIAPYSAGIITIELDQALTKKPWLNK